MAMGKRSDEPVQGELFVTSADLPRSLGHPFYVKLNQLLAGAGFDGFVEGLCAKFYDEGASGGRPGIPPGTYFRMLFVGYFEGIDSQRGIAWRCADSMSLREFLGLSWREASPEHSSLTKIRQRLDQGVHDAVFEWVLKLCAEKKLLTDPKTVGVDSTTLEANAAMRSIVRTDSKQSYREYLKTLMKAEGVEDPTAAEVQKFDRDRKDKTCSNAEWESPVDPDAKIARMKDGTTHLAYKSEHVVDLKSEVILAAEIYPANQADTQTLTDSVTAARCHLTQAGRTQLSVAAAVADKGYHGREQLALAAHFGVRTYVAEPDRPHQNRWVGVPADQKAAVYANRRRGRGTRGKALQRLRSEKTERSFAHVCETGGSRRTWLRGLAKVRKRYAMAAAARNLGLLMRKVFGIGKPRVLQPGGSPGGGSKGGGGGKGSGSGDGPGGGGKNGPRDGPETPETFLRRLIRHLHARVTPNAADSRRAAWCPVAG
jgi:transposase